MPRFSIIIPVYKVEKYIKRCVDSILSQNFTEYEVILVDDGSPDKCPQICDEYASKYGCVKVIHKINGGSSSARNAGVDVCSGDYVLFVDSDDYWENSQALFVLNERIKEKGEDLILYSCTNLSKDGQREQTRGDYDMTIMNSFDKGVIFQYLVHENKMPGAAWIMATKRSLVESLHLRFPLNVTGEDYIWVLSLLHNCGTVGAVNGDWYVYVKREDSITAKARISGVKGLTMAINYAVASGFCDEFPVMQDYLARLVLYAIMSYGNLPSEDKALAKDLIGDCVCVLPQLQQYGVKLFGLNCISAMLRLVYSVIR